MKKRIVCMLAIILGINSAGFSQGFLKKLKEKASNVASDLIVKKGAEKAERTVDGKGSKGTAQETKSGSAEGKGVKESGKAGTTSYSKFDFVPGEKIVFAENFEQDVIGEFPLKWFTNGNAEVVTVEGLAGKWLKLVSGLTLSPTAPFPKNFILEYDMIVNLPVKTSAIYPHWQFQIFDRGDKAVKLSYDGYKLKNSLSYEISFQDQFADVTLTATENARVKIRTDRAKMDDFEENYGGGVVHVAMAAQDERLRIWFNAEKVFDLPLAVPINHNFNQMMFYSAKVKEGYPAFYISNVKLSEGKPDLRSKLMDEGRFVTNGIQFDPGSDNIKPVSMGILGEISKAIKDNNIKVKVIGHTDSDGSADSNLALSKKRAEAVKKILGAEFGVPEASMQTDGKGAASPVGDNKTSTGKAQNRRVEFVKL